MNDLSDLAAQLCPLLQSQGGDAACGAVDRGALRCTLDDGRWIGLHFQARLQRWLPGVGCATDPFAQGVRARLEEALLRVGHESRWGLQQAGLGDGQDVQLVDCDFPSQPAQLTVAAVESRLQALLAQFDALAEGRNTCARGPVVHAAARTRACGCAQAFSARMQSLDASRPAGSTAAQDLLLDDRLPVRISLHPRSHHWVFEAFVGHAGAPAGPLRRSLVATLLLINGAVLTGRSLVCSLDSGDRVVLISRWHLDWAAREPMLEWLDYSLRQARRIRMVAAAIALQGTPGVGDEA